jgi:formate hydrogenlyase subunit 3/multisubunit Na+/H+ antiporter MnhD subunit
LYLLAVLGLMGLITGELVAWRSKDMIRMLSFSSIGQLGLIFLAFSIPGEMGLMAGVALVLHHMLVKPALFMLAEGWQGSLENLAGVAKRSPYAVALFVLLILSLLGVPPLPGFWAKYLLLTGLAAQDGNIYTLGMVLVPVAIVIEVAYLFRVVKIMYKEPLEPSADQKPSAHKPLVHNSLLHRKGDLAVAMAAGALLLIITFKLPVMSDSLSSLARQTGDRQHYINTVFPETKQRTQRIQ